MLKSTVIRSVRKLPFQHFFSRHSHAHSPIIPVTCRSSNYTNTRLGLSSFAHYSLSQATNRNDFSSRRRHSSIADNKLLVDDFDSSTKAPIAVTSTVDDTDAYLAIELALDSVIFTVSSSPNYTLLWQNKSQRESMGSGFPMQVLEPHTGQVDEGFSEARVLAEVSLLPDKLHVASGRRAVAMATGVIDRAYNSGQVQKQILVVVTSGFSVMCFDHNLQKLWEKNLQEDSLHNAHLREITISVSNTTLKYGEAGLVLIGGRMEMQTNMHMDPFEEINMAVENAEQHRRSASEKEVSENSTVDLHHLAFYAFAGQSGTLHWTRKNEDIEADSLDASQLIPQHNYKLDVHALNSHRLGVVCCEG